MGLPSVLTNVKEHPGMYFHAVTFDAVVAFVEGYNAALCGGFLVGFREWLVVRVDDANNLAWSGLVLFALGDIEGCGDQLALIKGFFGILEEFIEVRDERDGYRKIYASYEKWLRSQEWYTPTSP